MEAPLEAYGGAFSRSYAKHIFEAISENNAPIQSLPLSMMIT